MLNPKKIIPDTSKIISNSGDILGNLLAILIVCKDLKKDWDKPRKCRFFNHQTDNEMRIIIAVNKDFEISPRWA
jgi:hypothetical protein